MVTDFHFVGLKTWRTLLLGTVGGLIPLAAYLFTWESLNLYQEIHYNSLFTKLVPVTILGSIVCGLLGCYASLDFAHAKTSGNDCTIKFVSPLRLFIPKRHTFRWDEVLYYDLENDIGSVLLTIHLTGNRKINTQHSMLIKGNDDFRAFVSTINQNTGL